MESTMTTAAVTNKASLCTIPYRRFAVERSDHRVAGRKWWVVDREPGSTSRWCVGFDTYLEAKVRADQMNDWK